MEETNISESDTVEELPHVPIKTYQWEDIKRSRKKGGYPWTHLTKPPFEEEVDAEMFTMDAYRRSRSSSTLKSETHETPTDAPLTEDMSQEQNLDEIIETKENAVVKNENELLETAQNVEETHEVQNSENKENLLNVTNSRDVRASSQEPSKKRKLSIESSHSRISLSKLAIKDKLKNAKEKLKIPQILKRSKSDAQETRKPKIQKKDNKRLNHYQGTSEPVYIHIPLKPPPGETDEYSKYEFESPGPSSHSTSLTNLKHFGSGKRKMSLLGLLTELKRIYDEQALASESTQASKKVLTGSSSCKSLPEKSEAEQDVEMENNLELEHRLEKSAHEIHEMLAVSPDDYSVSNSISQFLDKDEKFEIITTEVPNLDIDCVIITNYDEEPSADNIIHSNLNEFPEWTKLNPEENIRPRIRAKSEEPKRKRKSSIDSSYSRKSLSKIAFMKKLKDAKNSIKLPRFLSFSKADDKSQKIKSEDEKPKVQKQTEQKKVRVKKSESPLYIHIPLKLPKGETDEFSHLSKNDSQEEPVETNTAAEEVPECETPISPVVPENQVQLIFLTPPSDDEILDSNVPETPSESDQKFFDTLKVDELKCIAKRAVDVIYPGHTKLGVVVEDDKNEDLTIQSEGEPTFWQMHPVLVDVEDGLKLSDSAIAMINEEMSKEANLVVEPRSVTPQIKKKVSFKKARAQDGERIYEDVGLPSEPVAEKATLPTEMTFRSMSTDEEKSYLDEKVIKATSLDEDYNKWSKITDHEYEPVNPPPEGINPPEPLEVKANLTTNMSDEQLHRRVFNEKQPDVAVEHITEPQSVQNFQDQIEDRYFEAATVTPPSNTEDFTTKQLNADDQPQQIKLANKKKEKPAPKRPTGNNFNEAIRVQANKIKNKLQSIKKPHINLPQPPKFSSDTFPKLKLKKPNFTVPKMPDMPSLNLAALSLKRKNSSKNSWRNRQYSTESNAGDSKAKKFDFRTYPKPVKQQSLDSNFETTSSPVFSTVPRTTRSRSLQNQDLDEYVETEKDDELTEYYYDKTRGFVTIPIDIDNDNPLHVPSHVLYNRDASIDDGFNADVEDVELPQNTHAQWKENGSNTNNLRSDINGDHAELHSDQSSPSLSGHRQGVIEEIDSDQFFLREKGISQDDIDVGKYLSSEIKEAFRNPINALAQLQRDTREYEVNITDQSQSSEEIPKRKWLKKPKRKKTPHVSNEQLSFEFGSDPEDYVAKHLSESSAPTPARPKRRSKKSKKKKTDMEDVVPYQETIPFEEQPHTEQFDYVDETDLGPFGQIEDIESSDTYKNASDLKEEEPHIDEPLYINEELEIFPTYLNTVQIFETISTSQPVRPERKNKSTKSLNTIEVALQEDENFSIERSNNSFEGREASEEPEISSNAPMRPNRKRSHTRSESVTSLREHEPAILDMPPMRPLRLRSRTRSKSTPSLQDTENIPTLPPVRPNRVRSRTRSQSRDSIEDSQQFNLECEIIEVVPCIEERCIQIVCDRMGYAIVDKSKIRDPPLPPSRFPQTPPRTRRKKQPIKDKKFATVPRPPERPLRNYSTLTRPELNALRIGSILDDDKENVDVNPYIEIDEDELARRLQSGEVIQKMRERPLPAPPRPPRKARTPNREIFRNISHERNFPSNNSTLNSKYSDRSDIPDEISDVQLLEIEQQILTDDHEETITHAALIVQPIQKNSAASLSEFFNIQGDTAQVPVIERTILVEREQILLDPEDDIEQGVGDYPESNNNTIGSQHHLHSFENDNIPLVPEQQEMQEEDIDSDDEMSEVPADFHKLKAPCTETPSIQPNSETVANLKLQLLDVDKLRVNELTANKIVVTDLEGANINVSEINSKAGNLVISGIELPPSIIQEMLEKLNIPSQQPGSGENQHGKEHELEIQPEEYDPVLIITDAQPPPVPPRSDSVGNLVDETQFEQNDTINNFVVGDMHQPSMGDIVLTTEETAPDVSVSEVSLTASNEPPIRPPRRSSYTEKLTKELAVDDAERLPISCEEIDDTSVDHSQNNLMPLETISCIAPTDMNVEQAVEDSHCSEPTFPEPVGESSHHGITTTQRTPDDEISYVTSQPPLSFYNLTSSFSDDFHQNNIPLTQCRTCRKKLTLSRSSSSEELAPKHSRPRRLSEPSIPELTGQLVQSCAVEFDRSFRHLLAYLSENVLRNAEGKQDLQVLLLMLVILIASLILMNGDGKVEHHHHWEYFNPPREF